MKLINNFGLAALLVAFLAVPALAQHHHGSTGTSTPRPESSKEPQVQPSAMERPVTQTKKPIPPPGAKGVATDPNDVSVNQHKSATKAAEDTNALIRQ